MGSGTPHAFWRHCGSGVRRGCVRHPDVFVGYFRKEGSRLGRAGAFFLTERIALPERIRVPRVLSVLRRLAVREVLGVEVADLPAVYRACFGVAASSALRAGLADAWSKG